MDQMMSDTAKEHAGDGQGWTGELADHWADNLHRHEAGMRHLTPELIAAAEITPEHHVLDIGCGGGATTLLAAQLVTGGTAVGVDVSPRLISIARTRAAAGQVRNARFQCADAARRLFDSGSFDRVISQLGLMFFPDLQAAFTNLAYALRPGGRLSFLCWQPAIENEIFMVPLCAAATLAAPPSLGDPDAPGPFTLSEPGRIEELLAGVGMRNIAIKEVRAPMWIGYDIPDAVGYQLSSPLGRTLFAAASSVSPSARTRALSDAFAPYHGEDGIELECAAWLVTAERG